MTVRLGSLIWGRPWRAVGWLRLFLSEEDRGELARRARIVLLAAGGLSNTAIAERLGVSRLTVGTWRRRFAEKRLEGLDDEPRPSAPRKIGDDKIAEVVTRTLETVEYTLARTFGANYLTKGCFFS